MILHNNINHLQVITMTVTPLSKPAKPEPAPKQPKRTLEDVSAELERVVAKLKEHGLYQ